MCTCAAVSSSARCSAQQVQTAEQDIVDMYTYYTDGRRHAPAAEIQRAGAQAEYTSYWWWYRLGEGVRKQRSAKKAAPRALTRTSQSSTNRECTSFVPSSLPGDSDTDSV